MCRGAPLPGAKKGAIFRFFLIGCSSVIGRLIFTDVNEFEPTAWAGVLRLSKFHDTHCITLYLPRGEIVMADVAKCAAPTELILFELARLVGRNVGLRTSNWGVYISVAKLVAKLKLIPGSVCKPVWDVL